MYVGRFAPTPSGPLHLGSLVSALAAWLCARSHDGRFLIRIEDLDTARLVPGAGAEILRALEIHELTWDAPVLHQSSRAAGYSEALAKLRAGGLLYPCACTRREVADSAPFQDRPEVEGPVYPGTCRSGLAPGREARAQRVRTDAIPYRFDDAAQGPISQTLGSEVGDFVVARADGVVAYQLAVVVDDAAQGVTEVVRGADLLLSTPRQLHLQRLLALPTPAYLHHPVVVAADGAKLSKQHQAAPLDLARPGANLHRALTLLRQGPPATLAAAAPGEVLAWARAHWWPARFSRLRTVPAAHI